MLRRTFLCLVMALLLTLPFVRAEYTDPELAERFSNVRTLEYEGETWTYKNRLTTILIMGTDQRADAAPVNPALKYRSGGQADFLMLVLIDDNAKTVTPIQIDRDTVCEITTIGVEGYVSGTTHAQICLQHGFGDGREQSCELECDAVSRLLNDVDVDHYYAAGMDGIATFNDWLGGVTVTVNADLTGADPALYEGATVRLTGRQAEIFVRSRMTVEDGTNVSRLRRQRIYMDAVKPMLVSIARQNPNRFGELFDLMGDYAVTDMSRGRIINLAAKLDRYDVLPTVQIGGETVLSETNGFAEFYPREGEIDRVVRENFYRTKG